MNLVLAAGIVIGAVTIAVAIMLLVRRRAPAGSHFNDGDRAAGVFGVLATGFSVLLGFIVFLAFSSYDASRTGAEDEAVIVAQQVETAQLLPASVSRRPHRRPRLLRPVGRRRAVGAHGERHPRRGAEPLGRTHVPHDREGGAEDAERAGRLQQVARPDVRPGGGPQRSHPRRRRGDPDAAVGRDLLHLRRHRPVHALLRRPRRGAVRAGAADGQRRGRDRRHAPAAAVPRQPVPSGGRRAEAGRDGADGPRSSTRSVGSPTSTEPSPATRRGRVLPSS